MDKLTAYARQHERLIGIERRFIQVLARNRLALERYNTRWTLYRKPPLQTMQWDSEWFDCLVHGKTMSHEMLLSPIQFN